MIYRCHRSDRKLLYPVLGMIISASHMDIMLIITSCMDIMPTDIINVKSNTSSACVIFCCCSFWVNFLVLSIYINFAGMLTQFAIYLEKIDTCDLYIEAKGSKASCTWKMCLKLVFISAVIHFFGVKRLVGNYAAVNFVTFRKYACSLV